MRKSIGALAMIAIGALWLAAVPAAAATAGAGSGTAEVPANALGVRVASAGAGTHGLEVTLDPGHAATRRIVVVNRTAALRLTVRLEPAAASGAARALHAASWITLSDVVETLEPGAAATVSVNVLVPANAVPGAVKVNLIARVEHAVRAADGSPAVGTPSVSLPVAMTVKGAPTAQVSIVSVQNVTAQGRDYLAIRFQNVGATAMVMRGRARVAGADPTTYTVNAKVAPLTSTVVRVAWVKPAGSKGVGVSVDTEDARGDQASWNGSVGAAPPTTLPGPSARRTAATTTVRSTAKRDPIFLVVVAAVSLAVVWLLYEVLRATRRRRRRRRLAKTALIAAASAPAAPASNGAVHNAAVSDEGMSDEGMSEVAVQLGALVGAIDRLVDRLDSAPVPAIAAAQPEPAPAISAPAVVGDRPVPAPPPPPPTSFDDALRAAVAPAASVPGAGAGYPYDWPTSEQLDRFVAGRRAVVSDLD